MLNEPVTCTWTPDEDGVWWSCDDMDTCEHAFVFNDGGPIENHFKFCPYCGNPLVVGEEVPHD